MAIPHEHPTSPTDPNRGMNVKVFLISVAVATVLLAVILFVALQRKGSKLVPTPSQPNGPNTQLFQPAQPIRA